MNMFKCNDCGHLFEEGEEKTYEEPLGVCHGFPAYETFSGCPLCKGNYEEVEPCKICGTYYLESGEEYCEGCKADVNKRFRKFMLSFTEEETELLREMFAEEIS